jgi:hypothetical protein
MSFDTNDRQTGSLRLLFLPLGISAFFLLALLLS